MLMLTLRDNQRTGLAPRRLKPHKIGLKFVVVALHCPKVKWGGCNLVDDRNGEAIDGHVDRFEIASTGVTTLYANSGNAVRSIPGQLFVIRFAANRTQNAAEIPFRLAQ